MSGLSSFFRFNKPGKDAPDAPSKHPFFQFIELYSQNFTKLLLLNIIYFIIISPILMYLYTMVYSVLESYFNIMTTDIATILFQVMVNITLAVPAWLFKVLTAISLILYGPATAGMAYVLRNFVRREDTRISDFFNRSIKNFKQGVYFGVLDIVIFFILSVNMSFMVEEEAISASLGISSTFSFLMGLLSLVVLIFYSFSRYYVYTMLVTLKLRTAEVLRNGLMFSIVGFLRNLLVFALTLITAAIIFLIHPIIELILVPLVAFSLWGLITEFICYPLFKKLMLDKTEIEQPPQNMLTDDKNE